MDERDASGLNLVSIGITKWALQWYHMCTLSIVRNVCVFFRATRAVDGEEVSRLFFFTHYIQRVTLTLL